MKAVLNAQEFKRIIKNTKRFIRTSCRNNELMGWIYLQVDAGSKTITATALDGHRISIEYASCSAEESFNCYIKPDIPRISKFDNLVKLELDSSHLYVQAGNTKTDYVQPEGEYFPVEKMLNSIQAKTKKITFGVDADLLKDALKSVSKNDGIRKIVEFDLYGPDDEIVIRSGRNGERENIKIVLPVRLRDAETPGVTTPRESR